MNNYDLVKQQVRMGYTREEIAKNLNLELWELEVLAGHYFLELQETKEQIKKELLKLGVSV
jgi:hypothetical protein